MKPAPGTGADRWIARPGAELALALRMVIGMPFFPQTSIVAPTGTGAELTVMNVVQWLRLGVDVIGAVVLMMGVVRAAAGFVRSAIVRGSGEFIPIRLTLGRYLTLALEFQLGADILSTAVAPSWEEIQKLGAIAVIRTGLNFFLTRELREAGNTMAGESKVEQAVPDTT